MPQMLGDEKQLGRACEEQIEQSRKFKLDGCWAAVLVQHRLQP